MPSNSETNNKNAFWESLLVDLPPIQPDVIEDSEDDILQLLELPEDPIDDLYKAARLLREALHEITKNYSSFSMKELNLVYNSFLLLTRQLYSKESITCKAITSSKNHPINTIYIKDTEKVIPSVNSNFFAKPKGLDSDSMQNIFHKLEEVSILINSFQLSLSSSESLINSSQLQQAATQATVLVEGILRDNAIMIGQLRKVLSSQSLDKREREQAFSEEETLIKRARTR
jgi:hypothetical protein